MTNNQPHNWDELAELIGALHNETLSEKDEERLSDRLRDDSEARQYYLDYVLVQSKLRENSIVVGGPETLIPPPVKTKRIGGFSLIAAICCAAAVLLALGYFMGISLGPTPDIAQLDPIPPVKNAGDGSQSPVSATHDTSYVARISNVTPDAQWGDSTSSQEFLLRVRQNDRIELEQGLVALDYFTGARLILHGPCSFVVAGEAHGELESGRMTGLVQESDFFLSTAAAEVIDLGTEFGVSVDKDSNTDVSVFDGQVLVASNNGDQMMEKQSRLLTTGMSVRVSREKEISDLPESSADQFVRTFPKILGDLEAISLVDVFNGHREDRSRLASAIYADDGGTESRPWQAEIGPGNTYSHGFQSTGWHPFVDGVFIPAETGANTRTSSAGDYVDLPDSSARTWGPVWSRKRIEGSMPETYGDFWGAGTLSTVIAQLRDCESGMIGVHANVGITFDLKAIADYQGRSASEFRGMIANLDNSKEFIPEWAKNRRFTADFRLYIDGRLESERLAFAREDGELEIRVQLNPKDRFLTFISTDNRVPGEGDMNGFDHVVVIDPVLLFQPD